MTAVVEAIPSMVFVKRADDHSYVLLSRAGEKVLGHARAEIAVMLGVTVWNTAKAPVVALFLWERVKRGVVIPGVHALGV
jgi:hypothetical protein